LGYIDGLRAMAALWVAVHHAAETSVPALNPATAAERSAVSPSLVVDAATPRLTTAEPAPSPSWPSAAVASATPIRPAAALDDELLAGEFHGSQGSEPDPVGGLVDSQGKLFLHARPYVLELGAHGSVYPLLSPRK